MESIARLAGRAAEGVERDDRVLRATRWSGYVIAPVLLLAFVSLYGAPGETGRYFAWEISPELTPMLMGAGYGAGAYFFIRVVTIDEWHRVGILFPGIAAFTAAMAVATAQHWAAFNHGHPSTWLWVFLYVVTPVLIPALWIVNGRTDPGPSPTGAASESKGRSVASAGASPPDEVTVPPIVRQASGVVGAVLTVAIVMLFVIPDPMIDRWPWAVSPLTSRVLLGWGAVFSVASTFFAFEPRWSAAKVPIQSLVIWFGLLLVGFARSWADGDASNPILWALLAGITIYLVGLSGLYLLMERRTASASDAAGNSA